MKYPQRLLIHLLLSLVIPQVSRQSTQLDYDKSIASSSFGEPVFRLQPPSAVHYLNTQGATLVCLASGSPKATVSWYTSQSGLDASQLSSLSGDNLLNDLNSQPVTNITNLRLILQDGAVVKLLPFKESQFRQDVHSAEYRCVASNRVATIHSKSASVQAVIRRARDEPPSRSSSAALNEEAEAVRVNDEFVQLKAPAVLKCRLQSSSLADSGRLFWLAAAEGAAQGAPPAAGANQRPFSVEWLTSDGLQVSPAEPLAKANKLVAFESGELHLNNVEMADLRRTYGCRLRNATTRRVVASSNMARLILMDSQQQQQQQQQQVQVLHSLDQLIVMEAGPGGDQSGHFETDFGQPKAFKHGAHHQWSWGPAPPEPARHAPRQTLLLPCAVRAPPSDTKRPLVGQWLFQPAASLSSNRLERRNDAHEPSDDIAPQRPVTLEQLVAINRHWLQLERAADDPQHANHSAASSAAPSRLVVGATFLMIDRPRRQLSGRFLYRVADDDGSAEESSARAARTVCDISVIVRQPVRLQMRVGQAGASDKNNAGLDETSPFEAAASAGALVSGRQPPSAVRRWLASWFDWSGPEVRRSRRSPLQAGEFDERGVSLLAEDPARVRVSGPGRVQHTPILRIGDRLELTCLAQGHPIDNIRWFRQGKAVNIQSSSDFQTELSTFAPSSAANSSTSGPGVNLVSRLLIRQLQPRDFGLQMFECFAQNSLGDRARASLAVYVADRDQLEAAQARCPLVSGDAFGARNLGRRTAFEAAAAEEEAEAAGDNRPEEAGRQPDFESGDPELGGDAADYSGDEQRLLFLRRNPFKWALVLEGEPVELQCPSLGGGSGNGGEHHQIDWFKWTPNKNVNVNPAGAGHAPRTGVADLAGFVRQWRRQQHLQRAAASALEPPPPDHQSGAANDPRLSSRQLVERQFSQLFGGDSRFVINGSSLQIRSPSKRHDETLFVCLRRARHKPPPPPSPFGAASPAAAGQLQQQPHSVHQSSMPPPVAGRFGVALDAGQYRRAAGDCLESLFSLAAAESAAAGKAPEPQLQNEPLVSSISIRIVAKPKIDPFEFSRNLEEGMRTVAVCTVVSGQSLVDINWFKDGEPLLEDAKESAGISIDSASGFSSSLTFHQIRPSHSGHYTCIASNALAAAEHTSRLLVNVAPYFIEPPKSQRAYLNSNVLINCRADGQPRWRKLVPVGAGPDSKRAAAEIVAPLGGAAGFKASGFYAAQPGAGDFDNNMAQQMALVAPPSAGQSQMAPAASPKQEFRIITSNSHIQILENGSMIIREVELADAARYSCQANNGVQPILSEAVDLQVLSPAQFEVTYETVSVKRDSMVKLNCVPRGDQPLRIDWFKEGLRLARLSASSGPSSSQSNLDSGARHQSGKYNELLHVLPDLADGQQSAGSQAGLSVQELRAGGENSTARRHQLVLQDQPAREANSAPSASQSSNLAQFRSRETTATSADDKTTSASGALGSELVISSVDRSDSGLFVCLASNAFGKDELTYRLIVQEPPDAPFNLQVQSVQSTSLRLLWQSPFDGNTPINYFIVEYRRLPQQNYPQVGASKSSPVLSSGQSSGAEWTRVIVNSNTAPSQLATDQPLGVGSVQTPASSPSGREAPVAAQTNAATLKQLAPKSSYQIRVAAVNSLGQGLFAPIQLVSTAEEAPQTRPLDLRAQPVGSSAIKLSWRGPMPRAQDEAPVRGYYISHRRHQVDSSDLAKTGHSNTSGWLATVSVSANNYSAQAGPEPLLFPADGAADALKQSKQQQQQQKLVVYEFALQMLERSTKYDVRVQPFNSMGLGPVAELSAQTLNFDRPRQPTLKLVEARRQSLELKWSVPGFPAQLASSPLQSGAGPGAASLRPRVGGQDRAAAPSPAPADNAELLGFSLYYKCEFDDWQEIQLALIFHYVIENLRCGNKYQIYLSAYNSVGRSDPSDVMTVRTEGTVPQAPDKSVFFKLNTSEVALDMSAWSSGGCPISSFMIQFKRVNDKNWFILSEGATPFQRTDRIVIPDLKEATWYKLLVTAMNDAGTTNAEYIFGTLTADGQQMTPPNYLVEQIQQQQRQPAKAINSLVSSVVQFLSGAGSGPDNQQVLFPLSCILLLLVTSLATYLYYNTAASKRKGGGAAQKRKRPASREGKQTAKCQHNNKSPGGQLDDGEHTMQLLDRHLLRANSHSCLGGTADSTASSSSSADPSQGPISSQTLNLRHHHHHNNNNNNQNRHLFQSMLLSDSSTGKSQLLPAADCRANKFGQSLEGSSPARMCEPDMDQASALTNYVLDSFLNQQQASANSDQSATLGHCNHAARARQQIASTGTCRPATMKLFAKPGPQSTYFEGAASSSLSSSGLGGSSATQTSGGQLHADMFGNNLQLIDERDQQELAVAPAPNGFDLECEQSFDGAQHRNGYVDLIQQQQQQQQQHQHDDPSQQYHLDALLAAQIYREPSGGQQRLISSSSFASAADLLQRQQHPPAEAHQASEPIYQRLDRFKSCGLASCATLNPQLAARMKQHFLDGGQQNSFDERNLQLDNLFAPQTSNFDDYQQQQQQQQQQTSSAANGLEARRPPDENSPYNLDR